MFTLLWLTGEARGNPVFSGDEPKVLRWPGDSWESLAERRIRQAMSAGEFDCLPGFGEPIPGIDQFWDENSWVRQKLRDEQLNVLPPVLEARLEKERTLASLSRLVSADEVRRVLTDLNHCIRKAHFSTTDGPGVGVTPVEVEAEVANWQAAARVPAEVASKRPE